MVLREEGGNIMSKKKMTKLDWIAIILLIIGGLNWGLVGIFNFDLVQAIFGVYPMFQKIIYILVGISAVYSMWVFKTRKKI